jgi:hypothetical protein
MKEKTCFVSKKVLSLHSINEDLIPQEKKSLAMKEKTCFVSKKVLSLYLENVTRTQVSEKTNFENLCIKKCCVITPL